MTIYEKMQAINAKVELQQLGFEAFPFFKDKSSTEIDSIQTIVAPSNGKTIRLYDAELQGFLKATRSLNN
ncbi:MAG: hypothetical protein DRN27_05330 [Thermoplasmata archaeon]|nr:MAG: hypothetical protein DRN27_05330 [Thermoplasmata archaeon]